MAEKSGGKLTEREFAGEWFGFCECTPEQGCQLADSKKYVF